MPHRGAYRLAEQCSPGSACHCIVAHWTWAKHCIHQRKALHPPTQSIASANAKLCNRQRKALQPPTQSFASAYAKLCIRSRKRLLEKGLTSDLERSLHLGLLPHVFPTEQKSVHNAWTQERVRQIIRPYTSFSPSGEMVMSLRL